MPATATELDAMADRLERTARELRSMAATLRRSRAPWREATGGTITFYPPVDRSARQLTDGKPVPADHSHTQIGPGGQQRDYVVLTPTERAKGFVRPVRDAYRHETCGKITTMGWALAETYARDPTFYSGTFCSTCRAHFPVGEDGEFTWYEMDGREGPKVGT